MKEIALTKGKVALVDDCDFEVLASLKWHALKVDNCFYAQTYDAASGKHLLMHRIILGFPPSPIDHRDGNGCNNQRWNLRPANNRQNQQNRAIGRNNKSGFKGVFWCNRSQRWVSVIHANGQKKYLGWFKDPLRAGIAYNDAALKNFGEFARLNSI